MYSSRMHAYVCTRLVCTCMYSSPAIAGKELSRSTVEPLYFSDEKSITVEK